MRQFSARTVTGPIDPYILLVRLWPGPQMSRMLVYSVIIHLCLAATFTIVRAARLYLKPKHDIVYTVNLMEAPRPAPKKEAVKPAPPKPKPPEVKKEEPPPPPPKPEPKPEPKPVAKLEPKPEEKKIEPPKVEKLPPKKEQPEVIAKPEPPKPKNEAPPPPAPEPEPIKVARAPEPEPAPVVTNTVEVDTDFITPELKWYIETVRRKVWQNWIEPRHALSSSANIRVVIRFEIGRSGRFALQPTILEPSNNEFFDQSGFAAVMRAAPFPPLPESYSGETLGVQFGFEFGERA